ncbi:MAG: DUF554 domain-containing protein [Bacteroidota bacterium]
MKRLPIGTFVNMATIAVGSMIGLMLQQVLPDNIQAVVFQALALGILIIGVQMALKLKDEMLLIFIFSLMLGGILGEILGVKLFLDSCEIWINNNFYFFEQKRVSEGLIAAFVLFCASPITIVGAIEEGFQNKRELLLIKSLLDGITAVALASSYGAGGVLVCIIPMLFIQGGITLLAGIFKDLFAQLFTKNIIALISGVGGALLIALALKILVKEELVVANLLPALLVVILLSWGYNRLKVRV